jgi:hypothetical protein
MNHPRAAVAMTTPRVDIITPPSSGYFDEA